MSTKRVLKNVFFLYGKMFVVILLSFFTTKYTLQALGVIDYGIFSLIAGIIAFLSFLNNAMAVSTQRYLSFYQGTNDFDKQTEVFGHSILLHIIIAAVIYLFLQLFFLLFFNYLNIASLRLESARILYQFVSINVVLSVISVPFQAIIVSHEDILYISIVGIMESALKFVISIFLLSFLNDRLVIYGVLLTAVSLLCSLAYFIFARFRYREFDNLLKVKFDKSLFKGLMSYASWNLFGTLCSLGRIQGVAILFNLYLGAAVNAAYGLANQLTSQISFLSSNLFKAINPQIMKSEGAGNREKMLELSIMGGKMSFFLVLFISVPAILNMKEILHFWLKQYPRYTDVFSSLLLLSLLVNQLTIGLQSAIQATGKIKLYQFVVGGTLLLNIPICYFLLLNNLNLTYVLFTFSIVEFVGCILRVLLLKKYSGLNIAEYVRNVLLRYLLISVVFVLFCYFLSYYLRGDLVFVKVYLLSIPVYFVLVYTLGLSSNERKEVIHKIKKYKK